MKGTPQYVVFLEKVTLAQLVKKFRPLSSGNRDLRDLLICEDYCLVTPCGQSDLSQYFGVICCLQVQSKSARLYGIRSQNTETFMFALVFTRARHWLLPVEPSSHPHTLFSKPIHINTIVSFAAVSSSFLFRYSNRSCILFSYMSRPWRSHLHDHARAIPRRLVS
jgi:hypothetical protein